MKQFSGFPARMEFTPIPNLFLSTILSQISDILELKMTLHIFWALYRKRGHPRFITYSELLSNRSLMSNFRKTSKSPGEMLHDTLEIATQRGTLLHIALDKDNTPEDVYLLNTDYNRQIVANIQSGELQLNGLKAEGQAFIETEEQPDIFVLYEQNIGMLTPMIADELREAESIYPANWIIDAIKEATLLNKRSWRYVARILERWSSEGKSDGAYRRDSAQKTGSDKYIKGKYGHMVRR